VNEDYTSKYRRIKVPLLPGKDPSTPNEEVPQLVEEDRRHLVEASIVRVMKARKTLSHVELVAEVTRQLTFRFNANPQVYHMIGCDKRMNTVINLTPIKIKLTYCMFRCFVVHKETN